MSKRKLELAFLPILMALLIKEVKMWNKFCSVYCQNQQCNTQTTNDCVATKCANGFAWNATAVPPAC